MFGTRDPCLIGRCRGHQSYLCLTPQKTGREESPNVRQNHFYPALIIQKIRNLGYQTWRKAAQREQLTRGLVYVLGGTAASLAALASRNFTAVLASIWMASPVAGRA